MVDKEAAYARRVEWAEATFAAEMNKFIDAVDVDILIPRITIRDHEDMLALQMAMEIGVENATDNLSEIMADYVMNGSGRARDKFIVGAKAVARIGALLNCIALVHDQHHQEMGNTECRSVLQD